MSEQAIPILQEHQAPEVNTTNPSGYTPDVNEKKAIKLVNELFEKAKKHRAQYDQNWLDDYKIFRGRQWKETRPSYRHSEVINMVFQHIQSVVPILTDARQRFEFIPEEPSDTEFAEILDEVAENDWQRGNWTYKLAEDIYDSHFYGTALAEMGFDADARLGIGQIDLKTTDPFHAFPDPNARDVNENADFFVHAEPVDVKKLKREYPDKAKFIKADLIDLMKGSKTELDQVKFKSPVDSKTIVEGGSANETGYQDQALKITLYLKSDEFEETEKREMAEDGTEKISYEQRLKYPNGRKICIAGGVLLHDGPIPFEDGLFPFARLVNYIDPRCFWGISEVEQLKSPQKIFNKLISFSLDVLTLMGNPIWKVPNTAGVDTDNLFNRPGLVLEYDGDQAPTREEGVQLQPYVLQLVDRMRNWFDELGGSNDVSRGVRPEGITAASAISSLQEAAQTRIRQKSRNLDAFLQNLGQLYKNRVFQFYTSPRIIRVTGKEGAQKYFKFHIEHVENEDGTKTKIAKVRDFIQNPETGQYSEDIEEKQYVIRGDFDVRVATGSSLPFAKDVKFNRARQMFLDGVIDEEEYLKAADYPNYQAVLQRVQQAKAEKAQMEMAAKGGGMPPGEPSGPPPIPSGP